MPVTSPDYKALASEAQGKKLVLLYDTKRSSIGDLVLDACISDTHSSSTTITEHPVEDGSPLSDHIRPNPDQLRITGIVTDSPVNPEDEVYPERAISAYHELRRLKEEGVVVTIITTLRRYDNMALESLEVPRDAERGNMVEFTATFKEIRRATGRTVAYDKSKFDGGHKVAPPAPEPVKEEVSRSILDYMIPGKGR